MINTSHMIQSYPSRQDAYEALPQWAALVCGRGLPGLVFVGRAPRVGWAILAVPEGSDAA